jgi:hypothetical protein
MWLTIFYKIRKETPKNDYEKSLTQNREAIDCLLWSLVGDTVVIFRDNLSIDTAINSQNCRKFAALSS